MTSFSGELTYYPLGWVDVEVDIPQQIELAFLGRTFVTESSSDPDRVYRLHLLKNGSGFCNCPDFRYRGSKEGRPCKHLKALNYQKKIVKV